MKNVLIQLRCRCGEMLKYIRTAGEFSVQVVRRCSCGLSWRVELERTEFEAGKVPVYRASRIEVL